MRRGSLLPDSAPKTPVAVNFTVIHCKLRCNPTPGASFLVYDPAKTHPADDPTGAILGAATPTVAQLDAADARMIKLQGMPSLYWLRGGDFMGVQYGSSPVRYGLHRVVSDIQSGAPGTTAWFQVTPPLQPGIVVGDPVTLIKPVIKARLEPNPAYGAHRAGRAEGAEFSFVQSVGV